jgi:hypothetical protein
MEINLMERSHRRVAEWKRSKCPYVPSQAVSVVYNNDNLLHKRKRPEPNTVSSVTSTLLVTIDAKVDKSSSKDGNEMDTAKSETDDEEALRDKTTLAVLIQEGKLGTLQEAKTFKQVCTMRGLGYKEEGENVSLPHAQEVCPFHGESKQLLVPCIVGTTALRFDARGNRGARNTANKNGGMR